jgi:hypothetical protein
MHGQGLAPGLQHAHLVCGNAVWESSKPICFLIAMLQDHAEELLERLAPLEGLQVSRPCSAPAPPFTVHALPCTPSCGIS